MATTPGSPAEYTGNKLIIFTAIYIPVQIFCVALRYVARYMVEGPWGLDDAVILTSLAMQLCMAGISIGAVKNAGVGYHISYLEENDREKVVLWEKYLVAISTLYFAGVNIPKLAILALYRRLFPNKSNRIKIYALMGILIGLTIATIVTALAACTPFAANWNPKMPGSHCVDKEAFFRYGSLPNIVTDIVMLILPVRVVWNLHTTTRLKIGLTITFLTGSFGLITSIIRFATFFQHNSFTDGTWAAVDLIIWTQVEPGVYLISACLMTYRPLLERVGRKGLLGKLTRNSDTGKIITSNNTSEHNDGIALRPRVGPGFHRIGNDVEVASGIVVTTNIGVGDGVQAGTERFMTEP